MSETAPIPLSPLVGAQTQSALGAAADASVRRVAGRTSAKLDPEQIDKVSREFEAMFMSVMLNEMYKGVDPSKGSFGGGHGEAAFQGMMFDQIGKKVAESGGLGIAASVRREMLRMQEAASGKGDA